MKPEEQAELLAELSTRHQCHSFVLYGSRAHGTETPTSDIDIVCFGDIYEASTDCRRWRDYWLDAWLYPVTAAEKSENFLHLAGGRILQEQNGLATALLQAVEQLVAQPPEPLKPAAIQHLRTWQRKTLERIRSGDSEAWSRRYWMSAEMLENYFTLSGQRFRGFKQSMQWLEAHEPSMHDLFLRLYSPEADLALLEQMVSRLLAIHPELP